jgi:hypothetical protein
MKNIPHDRRQFLTSLGRLAAGGITLGGMSAGTSSPYIFAADTTAAPAPTEQPAHWKSTCVVDISKPGAVVADICRGQQLEEFYTHSSSTTLRLRSWMIPPRRGTW